jgi:polar amino acid transport system substrate-binding protein
MAPRNTRITDTAPAAMRGRTIGAQSSTIHANFLEDVYKAAGATIRLYGTQDEANLDLAAGRLDAVLADKVVLDEWIKAGKEGACCKLIADVKPDPKWFGDGVGAAFRQADNDLREMFNKALAEVIADGTYKKIQAKYFTYDIL